MGGFHITITLQLPVVTITTITTTIEHTKCGTCCTGGYRPAGHITYLWTSTVFINYTIIDGHVNFATYWICAVNTTTIEFTYPRMVDFEGYITANFFISCTCYDIKHTTIDITTRRTLV